MLLTGAVSELEAQVRASEAVDGDGKLEELRPARTVVVVEDEAPVVSNTGLTATLEDAVLQGAAEGQRGRDWSEQEKKERKKERKTKDKEEEKKRRKKKKQEKHQTTDQRGEEEKVLEKEETKREVGEVTEEQEESATLWSSPSANSSSTVTSTFFWTLFPPRSKSPRSKVT